MSDAEREAREMASYYFDGGEWWLAEQWELRADEIRDKNSPRVLCEKAG